MKSILDRSFRYSPSFDTDLKRTFARIRREQSRKATLASQGAAPTLLNIATIVRKATRAQY